MDTSLRIILLLVGIFIIAGIVWDTLRAKRQEKDRQLAKSSRIDLHKKLEDSLEDSDDLDAPENLEQETETVVLKKTPLISSPQSPLIQRQTIEDDRAASPSSSASASTKSASMADPATSQSSSQSSHISYSSQTAHTSSAPAAPVILNLMARQGQIFSGKKLLEAFNEVYLHFGEMQIFHYHEHPDGTGDIVFSVTSAVEPGVFDHSKMDQFGTPGLTFFFIPSRQNLSVSAFEAMLRIAKQLAMRLDGELRDDKRLLLTNHGIDRYRERVRLHA